ncbi:glycoside hydrolase family 71 protein [Phellopilus nigrolimitatus]|nr:glycoside hydrolase family 71 protein [Phellopilus nigrolimitatus]
MVGNTAPYTPSDWEEDIRLAHSHGIDGFALNIGKDKWQFDQVSSCFGASERSEFDFRLFLSFDMSSFASSTLQDIQNLKIYTDKFAPHPNYLQLQGKALVSSFAGESSLFGCPDIPTAWMRVKMTLKEKIPVYFIPSFFIDPARFREIHCMDGAFNWNGCWPIYLTSQSPPSEIHCPKLLSDQEYLRNLDGKSYMASVSPWFFTHYGKDSWNKNWIYRADDWLFVRRWEQLVSMRNQVDIVQVISWNDYGESHYLGPIKGAQPNSQAWVDGFDHTPWLHLSAYFARAFKTGEYPAVEEDRVYIWARPHPRNALAPDDKVGRPTGWELTDDVFWVVVLAMAPASVFLWSCDDYGSHNSGHTKPSEHCVLTGLSKLQCRLVATGGAHVQLVREGRTVLDFHPEQFSFNAAPQMYNFNAFVAMYPPLS